MWQLYSCVASCLHLSMSSSHLCHVLAVTNLWKLAAILELLPVTTATVERTFSSMKLIKTRLRSRMGENTLEHTMRICIEGPDQLSNDTLEAVVDHYKGAKKSRLSFWTLRYLIYYFNFVYSVQIILLVWVQFCVIDGRGLVGPAISLHHAMGIRICRLHKIVWCLAATTKSCTSYTGSFLAGATSQCMIY